MFSKLTSRGMWTIAVLSSVFISFEVVAAEGTRSTLSPVNQAEQTLSQSYHTSTETQKKIDRLDEQARSDYYQYLHTTEHAEKIERYNQQLATLVSSQQKELQDLEQQLLSLNETEQAALPLLNDMLTALTQFVARDLPFLEQERSERVNRLTELLSRADVSVAEKYRQILEAYQIEVEYGRTLEAYSGVLAIENHPDRDVTFLRLGRVGLYYQTSDGQQSGHWQNESHQWQVLDSQQNWSVQKGIQLALKQAVPELLELPIQHTKGDR